MAVDRGALSVQAQIKGASDAAASARATSRTNCSPRAGTTVTAGPPPRHSAVCSSTSCFRRTTRSSTSRLPKKRQATIINDLAERYPMIVVAQTVDKLKDVGFYWATRSGCHGLDLRRARAAGEACHHRGLRGSGRQDREASTSVVLWTRRSATALWSPFGRKRPTRSARPWRLTSPTATRSR